MDCYGHGHDHMVVAISAYHHQSCEFESRSWQGVFNTTFCDEVVSDWQQVDGVLRILRFLPPIKLTAMIYIVTKILLKVVLNTITLIL